MQLTEYHKFNCTQQQKRTLIILHDKYKINTSQFIRDAINEKLHRDKGGIISRLKEVREHMRTYADCPF